MCTLCKFMIIFPIFGQFSLKCATQLQFNGTWLPCSYSPVGVTRTCFIDSQVFNLCIITLLAWSVKCPFLAWPIFPDMYVILFDRNVISNVVQTANKVVYIMGLWKLIATDLLLYKQSSKQIHSLYVQSSLTQLV